MRKVLVIIIVVQIVTSYVGNFCYSQQVMGNQDIDKEVIEGADSFKNSNVIKFTEEEALKIRGKIPKPKGLVTLQRKQILPFGESFKPEIEKNIEKIIIIPPKK